MAAATKASTSGPARRNSGQGTRWHQAARGTLNANLTATLTGLLNVGWRPLTRVTVTPGGAHAVASAVATHR